MNRGSYKLGYFLNFENWTVINQDMTKNGVLKEDIGFMHKFPLDHVR